MRNRMTYLQMTSLVALCSFFSTGCGNRAAAPTAPPPTPEARAEETAMDTTYALVDHNFDRSALTADQSAMVDHALAAYQALDEADREYILGFVPNKLAPVNASLEDFVHSPDAVGASFAKDPELVRISQAMHAELGLTTPTTTSSVASSDGVGVQQEGLTMVWDCLTIVVIVLIVGATIIAVASIPGVSAADFCKNCQDASIKACAARNKDSSFYCAAGGNVQGNGKLDSKKDVYEAKGSENGSWVCQYQCL